MGRRVCRHTVDQTTTDEGKLCATLSSLYSHRKPPANGAGQSVLLGCIAKKVNGNAGLLTTALGAQPTSKPCPFLPFCQDGLCQQSLPCALSYYAPDTGPNPSALIQPPAPYRPSPSSWPWHCGEPNTRTRTQLLAGDTSYKFNLHSLRMYM